jgi:hypothetical protein
MILWGTHKLRVSSSLRKSKYIRMHTSILYFWNLRFNTSKYDGSICNVVQKSFFYEWRKQVKPPFGKRYSAGLYTTNFSLLKPRYNETLRSEFFKHTYEYLHYSNFTNTSLAKTFCAIPVSIWQQMILWGTHYLSFSSSLRMSKYIRMHHINPILLEVVV